MLLSVYSRTPEIYAYCHSLHMANPFFVSWPIHHLRRGSTTGGPVGPLLFCNTIQPLLSSLDSDLNLGFLDDVSLGGPADVVAADVAQITKVGGDMGLQLNASQCELIAHPNFFTTDALLQSFI